MNKQRLTTILLVLLISACSGKPLIEPWVKPYERQTLADPLMSFDRTPSASGFIKHMQHSREAARGADGNAGGGCGCN